jgi:anti-repressor protein
MNDLIKINYSKEEPTVSARELHQLLEVGAYFKDWFPRMCEYGFTQGIDFSSILSQSTGGRPSTDYYITIPMAKELCMIQRTEKGKQARKYFISL